MLFKKAIDARFRIKKLTSSVVGIDTSPNETKLMAFFVNPALLEQDGAPGGSTRSNF